VKPSDFTKKKHKSRRQAKQPRTELCRFDPEAIASFHIFDDELEAIDDSSIQDRLSHIHHQDRKGE
jgi:hypothetical protein